MKLIIILIAIWLSVSNATDDINYRLNDDVTPLHYDLQFKLRLDEGTYIWDMFNFTAETRILVKPNIPIVNEITLHARFLNISKVELRKITPTSHELISTTFTEPDFITDKLTIRSNIPLVSSYNYTITLTYSSVLNDAMFGLSKVHYVLNEQMELGWFAITNFSPHSARLAFPCFDEPRFKATFRLKIDHKNKYKSYSNTKIDYAMPVRDDDRTIDIFKKTPPMSPSNLGFFVADFKEKHPTNNFTILVQYETNDTMNPVYELSNNMLSYFASYTDIPYFSIQGMEKLTLVVPPHSCSGALQTWGLLCYSKHVYSCKEECPSDSLILKSTGISEEFSRIWFGNLVTSEWWGYAWLNDVLSYYFEHLALKELLPDSNVDLEYVLKNTEADPNTVLTNATIQSPYEISLMSHSSLIQKGGSIIQMFDHMMGRGKFKLAIRKYLSDNAYKTVTPEKLYQALRSQWQNPRVDLQTIFTDWTESAGQPIITLSLTGGGRTLHVTQKSYLDVIAGTNSTKQWIIPLSFTTNVERDFTNTLPKTFLVKAESQMINLPQPVDWAVANIRQTGYYKVNYDVNIWRKIGQALKEPNFGAIHLINRVQIIVDLFTYSELELVNYDTALEVLTYLEHETEIIPWALVTKYFQTLEMRLNGEYNQKLRNYIKPLLTSVYHATKSADLPQTFDPNTKQNIVWTACNYGIPDCVSKAEDIAQKALRNDTGWYEYDALTAYMIALKDSDLLFDSLFERAKPYLPIYLSTLACTPNEAKLRQLLSYVLENFHFPGIFSTFVTNECVNTDVVFDFIIENFNVINDPSLVYGLANRATNEKQKNDIAKIMEDNNEDPYGNPLYMKEQILELIDGNLKWYEKQADSLLRYLDTHQ